MSVAKRLRIAQHTMHPRPSIKPIEKRVHSYYGDEVLPGQAIGAALARRSPRRPPGGHL